MKPRTYRWKSYKLDPCVNRDNKKGECKLGHFMCNSPYCDDFQSPLSKET